MKTTTLITASLFTAGTVLAQSPAPLTAPVNPENVPPGAEWLLPIKALPGDPDGGGGGEWASGPNYKVSFDDGMTFFPVLGEGYPQNLPFRWRTEAIEIGGQSVAGSTATSRVEQNGWRYALDYGSVTEAYDVLSEGVEQTFVFAQNPGVAGDLIIYGQVSSPLHQSPVEAAVQSLVFADDGGKPIVGYSEAMAFDAAGRTVSMTTSYDGERISLTLDGAWLAEATWPVTVDPLTNSMASIIGSGLTNYPNVARDDDNDELMVSYSRPVSASDYDLYCRLFDDSLSTVAVAFRDLDNAWSSRYSSVALANDTWAVAFSRTFGTSTAVRVYTHDGGNTVEGSGDTRFLLGPANTSHQFPTIGGVVQSTSTPNCFIAFQRDANEVGDPTPNGANSEIFGCIFNVDTGAFGAQIDLYTGNLPNTDHEWPAITQERGLNGSWIVVWQSFNYGNANDDWDITGQRVNNGGGREGLANFGPGGPTSHKLHPQVAGRDGRYAVSYLMRNNSSPSSSLLGNEMQLQRFDWAENSATPSLMPTRVVSSGVGNALRANIPRAMAFNLVTDSHWTVAYRTAGNDLFIKRFGFDGFEQESVSVYNGPNSALSPGIAFNDDDNEVAIFFGASSNNDPLLGRTLEFDPSCISVVYGSQCGVALAARNNGLQRGPFRGSEFFEFRISNGTPLALTGLFAAIGSASTPLPGGCNLLLNSGSLVTVGFELTSGAGAARIPFPLASTFPGINVNWQAIQLVGSTITTSNGIRTQVR